MDLGDNWFIATHPLVLIKFRYAKEIYFRCGNGKYQA